MEILGLVPVVVTPLMNPPSVVQNAQHGAKIVIIVDWQIILPVFVVAEQILK